MARNPVARDEIRADSPGADDEAGQEPSAGVARRAAALSVFRRLGWGVADQAVSSLSNFALGFYVARSFGATDFGAFTLAFLTYSVALNAHRGAATDPLLVRFSGVPDHEWRRAAGAAAGTSLLVGVAAAVLSAVAGLLLPGQVGHAFLALAVGLPALMLQDAWRFVFFAHGRGGSALLNDLVWTVLLVGALAWLHVSGRGDVVTCLLAFGATAAVAAGFGIWQARVAPRPGQAAAWLREHRALSARYLVENLTASGGTQLRSSILGWAAGLAAVGYVRGAELLMGPFVVVLFGVSQVAVPEAARALRHSGRRLVQFCLALGGVQAAAALVWGLALILILPLGGGTLLLKDIWVHAQPLLPAVTLNVIAASFVVAALSGVRATGMSWRSLRAQLVASALYVIGGVGGALWGGAQGTAWGVMLANAVGALVWWHQLRSAVSEHRNGLMEVNAQ